MRVFAPVFTRSTNGWPVVVGSLPCSIIDPVERLNAVRPTYTCRRCGCERQIKKGRNTQLCQDCRSVTFLLGEREAWL